MRSGDPHQRSLEIANQPNREDSLHSYRLALGEECLERLLRIIRPHSLRKHRVFKLHCLLQLFA